MLWQRKKVRLSAQLGIVLEHPAGDGRVFHCFASPCLDFQPAPVLAPITLFARDSAVVGFDFSPKAFGDFAGDAFTAREGDLGFTIANGMPKEGHDIVRMEFLGPRALAVMIFTCISCPYPNLARQEWK